MHARISTLALPGAYLVLFFVAVPGLGCGYEKLELHTDGREVASGGQEGNGNLGESASGSSRGAGGSTGGQAAIGGNQAVEDIDASGGTGATGGGSADWNNEGFGSIGGQGGSAEDCFGAECPPSKPCCDDLSFSCEPWSQYCTYCAGPSFCPEGTVCDMVTDQCMIGCRDDPDCVGNSPFCDEKRNVCVACKEDWHCRDDLSCVRGACVPCEKQCF